MDENYTRVHNKILEALYESRFPGSHMAVILYILRKTYGWNKPSDRISISKMARETGYTRRWLVMIISDLEKMCVLEVTRNRNGIPHEMQLRPPEDWDKPVNCTSHEKCTTHVNSTTQEPVNCTSQEGVNSTTQVPVNCTSHTKYIYKDNLKEKEIKGSAPSSSEDDDDDWEDPMELLRRLRDGDL